MHLKFRNVNDAFTGLVEGIYTGRIAVETLPSRNGEVLQIAEPVIVEYSNPRERVLFNAARDANPFFHLYEALWMLAGRNDIASLDYYCGGRYKQYSDDGLTANGAYGYRWRHAPDHWPENRPTFPLHGKDPGWQTLDQLAILIDHLKRKPESRRAVLQMWNVEDDLLKLDTSKDVCCNLSVMFSIGQGKCRRCDGRGYTSDHVLGPNVANRCAECKGMPHDVPRYLNMTVTNRSNDMILGMLGANVVHFSFLQEYMAAHLGLEVGTYWQISNNLHVYTSNWEPEKWLEETKLRTMRSPPRIEYFKLSLVPLVSDPATFDKEVTEFVDWHSKDAYANDYKEPFLNLVAQPMLLAFHYQKRREYGPALLLANQILADDWRIAATAWIEKRASNYAAKASAKSLEGDSFATGTQQAVAE